MNNPIYLDFAATTPVDPRVLEAMMPYFSEHFGNASSNTHQQGDVAREAIKKARRHVSDLINCENDGVIFTSGSTESINMVLKGLCWHHREWRNHIITVKTEHKAILDTCAWLEDIGTNMTYLDVDHEGLLNWEQYEEALKEDPLLVCIMHVNNETGVIQDLPRAIEMAHNSGAWFFSDATQSFGKIPINVQELDIDMLCFSAHKIYGPKGIGGLFIKNGIELTPLIHGGGHQDGMRSGTLNVPGIVGMGKAAEIAKKEMHSNYKKVKFIQEEFERSLIDAGKIIINGSTKHRSPYISNIQLKGIVAEDFILKNRSRISIATGSACNAEVIEPSHVLQTMGIKSLGSSIRISISDNSSVPVI